MSTNHLCSVCSQLLCGFFSHPCSSSPLRPPFSPNLSVKIPLLLVTRFVSIRAIRGLLCVLSWFPLCVFVPLWLNCSVFFFPLCPSFFCPQIFLSKPCFPLLATTAPAASL